MKIMLVCSSGGHFKAIQQLHPFWKDHQRVWVTFKTATTEAALIDETVHWAHSPTNRNLQNLVKNLFLALRVLMGDRPDLIVTTGAGVAVPFLILGKLRGSQTVFIESVTRVTSLSLSAKLTLPFLSTLYVHWPQLQSLYPNAELIGTPQGK